MEIIKKNISRTSKKSYNICCKAQVYWYTCMLYLDLYKMKVHLPGCFIDLCDIFVDTNFHGQWKIVFH